MLLTRQHLANQGRLGITLTEKEIIDKTDWNVLVQQSRAKLKGI